jgi:hypothetical protein
MKKTVLALALLLTGYWSIAQAPETEQQIGARLVQQNAAAIGLKSEDVANSLVSESYRVSGSNIRMVYLQQTYQGIPVYNRMNVLAFRNEALVSTAGERIAAPDVLSRNANAAPGINASAAVAASISALRIPSTINIAPFEQKGTDGKFRYGKLDFSLENVVAELIWLPNDDNNELKLVWQVFVAPRTQEDYWLVRIDARNGSFIDKQSLTLKCNWGDPNHSELAHNANHKKVENPGNQLMPEAIQKQNNNAAPPFPFVVNTATYRVIKYPAESPIHPGGAHTLVTDPWLLSPGNATSLGWHFDGTTTFPSTRGNNVHAYEDRNADNLPGVTEASSTPEPSLTFNFVPDLTQEPVVRTPAPNQQFNTTNLFYWNNLMHDLSYIYGFTETARNFQNDNQGRGGAGADYVLAESQDGSGTNNANFSTPADGGRGRMQMYLWTAPTPDRDGDVDNGIIAHEYTHGISNRFTGNGSTCLTNAEQMGEGWSDYFGLMITHDWAASLPGDGFSKPRGIGTYALNQPITGVGIRQFRYTTDMTVNPMTYGDLATVVAPHGVGTIWCTALWDMTWEIIQTAGINPNIFNIAGGGGNAIALKLVSEGMRLQPCSPGFIDGRNAILKADTLFFGAQYSCAIIKAFARRGMGIGASQGSSNSRTDQTLSFVECTSAACVAPSGLASSAITTTSATVSWNAVSGALSYDVDYKANASAIWINAATATTSLSVNLSGLTANTLYDWRVRTNCTAGPTAYTQAQFTTQPIAAACVTAFEPNETQATAAAISAGVANSAAISTATDNDYFKITTTGTNNITYSLVGPAGVDYDMTILNSAGTSIGSGTGATATETVTLNNQAAGTYSIRVFGFNGANSQTCYTLTVTVTPVAAGCANVLDNSTNGTLAGAATIPFNTNVTGLISPTSDIDHYKFVITTGGTATVTLTTLPADYDLKVLNSAGTQLAISQAGGTTSESIARTYTPGTYYAQVFGFSGANNATVCYTLRVALGTASFGNDMPIAQSGIYPNPAKDKITVQLNELNGTANISVTDINGKMVMQQRSADVTTELNISKLPSGIYMVKAIENGKTSNWKFVKE